MIGYWISTTTKEGFLFAGQKFRFDWCSWNFFCPSTQNGNVWDIRDKIYLWIIFFREPQTKDISPAETKKYQNEFWGITRRKQNWRVLPWVDCFKDWSKGTYFDDIFLKKETILVQNHCHSHTFYWRHSESFARL